jgi:hypothetical protein
VSSEPPGAASKPSGDGNAIIRAAYITLAGVVLAAVIGAAVTIYSNGHSNKGAADLQHSPSVTPSASSAPTATATPPVGKTWTEYTFSQSKTFADFVNAGDPLGPSLTPEEAVKVSCRVKGFAVNDGDRWWYRLAQSPWDGRFYATTDVFYNTPTPKGNPRNGIWFDKRVPVC